MENTLYYTFSTIAQVEVAVVALVGLFFFFQVQKIYNIQIGQGKAILNWIEDHFKKMETTKYQYPERNYRATEQENLFIRLGDAIHRNNIFGVEEIIILRAIEELEKNKVSKNGYTNHILPKYLQTKNVLKNMAIFSAITLIIGFASIIVSILSLSVTHQYYNSSFGKTLLFINLILFLFSMTLSLVLILWMLFKKLPFEIHKINENKQIYKKYLELLKNRKPI